MKSVGITEKLMVCESFTLNNYEFVCFNNSNGLL